MPVLNKPFSVAEIRGDVIADETNLLNLNEARQSVKNRNILNQIMRREAANTPAGNPLNYEGASREYLGQTGDIATAGAVQGMTVQDANAMLTQKLNGLKWLSESAKMVGDQTSYDQFKAEAERMGVVKPGMLPAVFNAQGLQRLSGETAQAIQKITMTSGDQQQDFLMQGGTVVGQGEPSPRWQPREQRNIRPVVIADPNSPTGRTYTDPVNAMNKPAPVTQPKPPVPRLIQDTVGGGYVVYDPTGNKIVGKFDTEGQFTPNNQQQVSSPTTEAEYEALPSGALFVDPDDGQTYRKP